MKQKDIDSSAVPGLRQAENMLRVVGTRLEGNDYTKLRYRRQLYALTMKYGVPTLWITISPSEMYSPLIIYFAGVPLDLSKSAPDVPSGFPEFEERLRLI